MKTTTIKSVFQFRRATTEEWESVNPILRVGEPAYDITLKKHKIGDGVTVWNDLPYQEGTGTADKIDWANILNAPTKLSQFDNDLDIPDSSYIDEKLAQKADVNHNHDGVYQPVGDYLTEETDPTVPEWAKQAEKPTYDYTEIKNTPDLTEYIKTEDLNSYAKIEYVDSKIEEATQGFEKYDDTEIKNRIAANEESIKSLSGDGEGSVKQTVADAIAEVVSGAPEDFDTLKEVADWIKNDTTGAAKMANDIAALNKKEPIIDTLEHRAVLRKVEIGNVPTGTLVNYGQDEVRVMAPSDTVWTANRENKYYMSAKLFAPSNAKYFRESLAQDITDETYYEFENYEFSGIDEHGCKYSLVWLPMAEQSGATWTYTGSLSAMDKGFIGWYWHANWYDENKNLIGSDIIRINLSNESCHNFEQPYYMIKYATKDSVKNPLNITGAEVGQVVKVKSINENGAPTEWETADISSGGTGKDPLFISAQKFHDRPGTTLSYAVDAKDFSRVASVGEKANIVITNAADAEGVWAYFCEATVEDIASTDEDGNPTIYAVMLSSICDLTPSDSGSLAVTSVNGKTGAVVLKAYDIINTSTDSNKISVASDGTLEVNSITVNKIVQDEEDELVIFGGNA